MNKNPFKKNHLTTADQYCSLNLFTYLFLKNHFLTSFSGWRENDQFKSNSKAIQRQFIVNFSPSSWAFFSPGPTKYWFDAKVDFTKKWILFNILSKFSFVLSPNFCSSSCYGITNFMGLKYFNKNFTMWNRP